MRRALGKTNPEPRHQLTRESWAGIHQASSQDISWFSVAGASQLSFIKIFPTGFPRPAPRPVRRGIGRRVPGFEHYLPMHPRIRE